MNEICSPRSLEMSKEASENVQESDDVLVQWDETQYRYSTKLKLLQSAMKVRQGSYKLYLLLTENSCRKNSSWTDNSRRINGPVVLVVVTNDVEIQDWSFSTQNCSESWNKCKKNFCDSIVPEGTSGLECPEAFNDVVTWSFKRKNHHAATFSQSIHHCELMVLTTSHHVNGRKMDTWQTERFLTF